MLVSTQGHTFADKLTEGESGERFIAECLKRYGDVRLVNDPCYQKIGIDAFLISPRWGFVSLQFKRCNQAARYGNAFIETAILNEQKVQIDMGWAWKTTANYVAYWTVGMGLLYFVETMELKRKIPALEQRFKRGIGCSRDGERVWFGKGVCVPLCVFRDEVARFVMNIREEEKQFLQLEV